MRAPRLAGCLAASTLTLALALAACGGDDDGADPEADQATADAAIDGFVDELEDEGFGVEEDEDDDEDDLEFESEDCQEFAEALDDDAFEDASGKAESGQLSSGAFEVDGGETTVEGKAALVVDADDTAEVFALYDDDRLGDCLLEAFEASFAESAGAEGVEIAGLDFEQLDAPSVGEEAFAFRIEGDLEVQGLSIPFTSTFLLAREGRAAAQTSVTDFGDGAPSADGEELLELLLDGLIDA